MTIPQNALRRFVCDETANIQGYAESSEDVEAVVPRQWLTRVGGGIIMRPPGSECRELHIFPHGGTQLPVGYLEWKDSRADLPHVASLITANADTGTSMIARTLALHALSAVRTPPRFSLAYFCVSRLFLDANREGYKLQVPLDPYVGNSDEYRDYLVANGRDLRRDLLQPWLDEVNRIIADDRVRVVYHHHTMDIFGHRRRDHDIRPFQIRPHGQLFLRYTPKSRELPAGKTQTSFAPLDRAGRPKGQVTVLAPDEVVEQVRATMRQGLAGLLQGEAKVQVDDPLRAPRMPFYGLRAGDPPINGRYPWHIVYELRKDTLVGTHRVDAWLATLHNVRQLLTSWS